jgi:hypothetical protein
MNDQMDFDALMKKGDSESVRLAFELLRASSRLNAPSLDSDVGSDRLLASTRDEPGLDLGRLERIALTRTPRERIDTAARNAPHWLQVSGSLLLVAVTFAVLMGLAGLAPQIWQSDGALYHRILLGLLAVMVGTLSVVTVGGGVAILMRFTAYPETAPIQSALLLRFDRLAAFRMSVAPLCAVLACIATASWFSADLRAAWSPQSRQSQDVKIIASRITSLHLTPEVEIGASVMALRDDGLQVQNAQGRTLSPDSEDWDRIATSVESQAIEVLRPVVLSAPEDSNRSARDLRTWLVGRLDRSSANACVIDSSEQLRCRAWIGGKSFTGQFPLERVAANMTAFRDISRYANTVEAKQDRQ